MVFRKSDQYQHIDSSIAFFNQCGLLSFIEAISLSQFGRDSTPPSQPNWTFDGHAWHIWKMGRDHSWFLSIDVLKLHFSH